MPARVPLESDPSAALAYQLEGAPIWDFELAGFRQGDFPFLGAGKVSDLNGLFMLHPYHPDMIPVVFVHGTASSPARWAEMANELLGDRAIASRYQLWFFIYNSGNPIALSAMRLRESLVAVRKDVDPDGKDPALNQMVVIGHSQGGLLTKMTVVDSGNRFWNNFTKVPFDKADLDPETRDLVARAMFVKPLPFVKRGDFHRDAASRQLHGEQSDRQVRKQIHQPAGRSCQVGGSARQASRAQHDGNSVCDSDRARQHGCLESLHQDTVVVADRARRARAFDHSGEGKRAD